MAQTKPTFMTLPREIRDKICNHLLQFHTFNLYDPKGPSMLASKVEVVPLPEDGTVKLKFMLEGHNETMSKMKDSYVVPQCCHMRPDVCLLLVNRQLSAEHLEAVSRASKATLAIFVEPSVLECGLSSGPVTEAQNLDHIANVFRRTRTLEFYFGVGGSSDGSGCESLRTEIQRLKVILSKLSIMGPKIEVCNIELYLAFIEDLRHGQHEDEESDAIINASISMLQEGLKVPQLHKLVLKIDVMNILDLPTGPARNRIADVVLVDGAVAKKTVRKWEARPLSEFNKQ